MNGSAWRERANGPLWMLLAGFSFALMSVLTKLLAEIGFSSVDLIFYRSAISGVLMGIWLAFGTQNSEPVWRGPHQGLLFSRSLVGFAALICFFYGITHLPVSVAVTLNYTSPVFLALLLPLTLGERVHPRAFVAVAIGFVGILMLLRPWNVGTFNAWAALVALCSGFLAGVAYLHVRHLGRLGIGTTRVVIWFAVLSTLAAGVMILLMGAHQPVWDDVPWLLAMGVFATTGQVAVTRAYRRGNATVTASFAYSTVLFSSLMDVLIWPRAWPWQAFFGMALTVMSGLYAVRLSEGKSA